MNTRKTIDSFRFELNNEHLNIQTINGRTILSIPRPELLASDLEDILYNKEDITISFMDIEDREHNIGKSECTYFFDEYRIDFFFIVSLFNFLHDFYSNYLDTDEWIVFRKENAYLP